MAAFETAKDTPQPVAPHQHPSGPLPVHGAPVGKALRVPLGETGLDVFPLILGAAEFGWHVDLSAAHAILDRYVDRGGNAVHTSDSYAAGRSEHVVGQWMQSRRNRDDVVLAVRVGRGPDNPGLGSTNLVRAVEASLTRLVTDRIDVLYLDGTADHRTLLEDTLATAEWLVDTGKVRSLGASGHRAAQLVEARILSAAGYPRLTVLDVPYNVLRRGDFDGDLRLVAGAQGIAVTPSQALEHGYLSGAHRARDRVGADVRGRQLAASMNRRGARTLRALDRIAAELAVPPAAIAIAWLLAQRVVVAPIVNAYAASHVDELVQGVGVHLSRAHLAEIARAAD
ncbi:aldo/keto reductase [Microbacterium sp. EYE_5]|uniref:aldo/keto reductase n=1 Tax=unclassified Microbacterium TaxID=2609290 RepID=UPI002004C5D5|nr:MULTISPECIES: aldo/keto reductase [unclassified Microbacterium]MCK6081840.1 aldo/keto reductase [Microbacterium sp. EYE_382]MCK6087110.1 aldo/keto reductase [Microbacterium sp. EYE_384]MCK6124912.1 aldo/keto reductase [Microbacterium sp. EYE_80]MCK6127873.1 aldo/keto reductase [Microbacterium sp. EYE_79]MCK6142794.1 aldo/keto reductase [Microbacterium sp. EYE_39]